MQLVRPSSPPSYQTSGHASLAARVAGSITRVLTQTHPSAMVLATEHSFSDAHLALSAVKGLGRHPSGSSVIALENNLSTLLTTSKSLKDSNLEASLEALRCIANALLLIESARATIISDSVNGGEYGVLLLEVSCPQYPCLPGNLCSFRSPHHRMLSSSLHASSFLQLRHLQPLGHSSFLSLSGSRPGERTPSSKFLAFVSNPSLPLFSAAPKWPVRQS